MDGTDFRIQQVLPFSTTWNSHKFKGPGVRYEVGIAIQTGWIVWTAGPYRAHVPDTEIFRSELKAQLLKTSGERVEADADYGGEHGLVDLPDDMIGSSRTQKKAKSIVRSRHETCNKRFKQFNCLKQVLRHELFRHKYCFEAVVVLTQLMIQNGYPLFEVKYKTRLYPTFDWFDVNIIALTKI